MYIRFGTRLFGSTDSVSVGVRDGADKKPLFHVATQFFHINDIPLIPFSSYLVFDFLDANRRPCIEIPTSCKSIGIAWLRFLSWLSLFISGICLIAGLALADPDEGDYSDEGDYPPVWQLTTFFLAALVCSCVVTWHGFFNNASHGRAMELMAHMNLEPRHAAAIGRLVDKSFNSECADLCEGEFESLARTVPTATAELVDGAVNDLELTEGNDSPSDGTVVPIAVAVAQPTMVKTAEITYDTKGNKADVPFENENEGRFNIV